MKIYCLTQNQELDIGLKLAGCKGIYVNSQEINQKIDEIIKKEDLGILVINKNLYEVAKEKIEQIRLRQKLPLITII